MEMWSRETLKFCKQSLSSHEKSYENLEDQNFNGKGDTRSQAQEVSVSNENSLGNRARGHVTHAIYWETTCLCFAHVLRLCRGLRLMAMD